MPHRKRYSLRLSLLLVVLVCVVPAASISTALIYKQYQVRRDLLDQTTVLTARKVSSELDRELSSIESGLRILATSPDLARGDLKDFQQLATKALASGVVYNYILTTRDGRQVMNTLRPFGTPLPVTNTPPALAAVFTERKSVLTGLFIGPVTGRHAIAMGVPVVANDEVTYSLNVGLAPSRIEALLKRQQLPEGWLIAVVDQNDVIVARTREAERFVGQKPVPAVVEAFRQSAEGRLSAVTKEGIPVITAFTRSEIWPWRVVIGAPTGKLYDDLTRSIVQAVVATSIAIVLGVSLALGLARRIVESVRGLNDAAARLGNGEPVELPETLIQEAEAVGQAIVSASRTMAEIKFFALHDALTGLVNRRLFEDFARQQMARAERNKTRFAIVAIDLDGFKQVNDTWGHQVGDEVLIEAAQRIQQSVREYDVAARMGGDEFFVLLCNTDEAEAMKIAGRIVEALSKPYPDITADVSASAGVSLYPDHGLNLTELISRADQALYDVKTSGKRRAKLASLPDPKAD